MKSHISNDCPLKVLTCDDCKTEVVRKNMDNHRLEICPERICTCPYNQYGCNEKVKAKELEIHLAKSEVQHLKLQVM